MTRASVFLAFSGISQPCDFDVFEFTSIFGGLRNARKVRKTASIFRPASRIQFILIHGVLSVQCNFERKSYLLAKLV